MMDRENEDFIKRVNLSNRQKEINRMFKEEGLTDEILKKQVEINSRRHELDIVDREEIIFKDDKDKEFVQ